MPYSTLVRRNLVVVAAIGSLLWGACGVAVLATAAHELRHHSEAHDHGGALQIALHGHAHQGEPDHDHQCAAPVTGSHPASLHPVQIDIAKKVFTPPVDEVRWARRVIAEMGDGSGCVMIDGKMQDDATVKQCKVMVELAKMLAEKDADLKAAYQF